MIERDPKLQGDDPMLTTHLLSFQREQSYFEQVEYSASL